MNYIMMHDNYTKVLSEARLYSIFIPARLRLLSFYELAIATGVSVSQLSLTCCSHR